MLNIVVALRLWGPRWAHSVVTLFCDNISVVQVVDTGSTRDLFLASCTRNIWLLTASHDIRVVKLIPRASNSIADLLSRSYSDKPINQGLLSYLFIYLFGVLHRFQHCTGHITTGSWKGRGNQYIQFVRVLYCKLLTNGKQLPAFPLEAVLGIEPRPQRWEARMLPLCHRGPFKDYKGNCK